MSEPQAGDIVRVLEPDTLISGAHGVVTSIRQWSLDNKYSWVIVDFPMDLRRWMKVPSLEVVGHVDE